jgi:hypothetical protein
MKFAAAERVAEAVLYEGYALYPYRPSAAKNQFRWQFGVLAPRAPGDDAEPWYAQTECLIEDPGSVSTPSRLSVCVRCLRPQLTAKPATTESRRWLEGSPVAVELPAVLVPSASASLTFSLDFGIDARLTIESWRLDNFLKIRVRVENHEPWHDEFAASRDAMLRRSLVGAHLLLGVDKGAFVSLLSHRPTPPRRSLAARTGIPGPS